MKRIVLTSIILFILPAIFAWGNNEPTPESNDRTILTQNDYRQGQRRARFQKKRLEYIVQKAKLNEEEQQWLERVLVEFDEGRAKIWIEKRQLQEELEARGDQLTDQQCLDYFKQLIRLNEENAAVQNELINALTQHFSPKQAVLIYEAMDAHNQRMGREMREQHN